MPMYNLIAYSDNYLKASRSLWKFCRDEPAVDDNGAVTDFTEANADTNSFKRKEKLIVQTGSNGTKYVDIMVPLKYLSDFWRTLEMLLIKIIVKLLLI